MINIFSLLITIKCVHPLWDPEKKNDITQKKIEWRIKTNPPFEGG